MRLDLNEIVKLLGAELEYRQKSNLQLTDVCALDDGTCGGITFCTKTSPLAVKAQIDASKAEAVLVSSKLKGQLIVNQAVLLVANPLESFVKLVEIFRPAAQIERSISPRAEIHPSAKIGSNVAIGAFTVVGVNVVIEDGAILHPHVTLYQNVVIGRNAVIHSGAVIREGCIIGPGCIIHNGTVIGADGFGYFLNSDNKLQAVPQVGAVQLSAHVEVGANTCIDRGTLGMTNIGVGTKIDNLVQVAHNVQIGSNSIICGQTGIAGSAMIGNYVTMGARVGVADHVKICDGARFAGRTSVTHDIEKKGDYGGTPAVPITTWRRMMVAMRRLAVREKE